MRKPHEDRSAPKAPVAIAAQLPAWIKAWVATISWTEPKDAIAAEIKAGKYEEDLRKLLSTSEAAKELDKLHARLKGKMPDTEARAKVLSFLRSACRWAKLSRYHDPRSRSELVGLWEKTAKKSRDLSKALRRNEQFLPLIDIAPLIKLPGLRRVSATMEEYLSMEHPPLAWLLERYAGELEQHAAGADEAKKKRVAGPDAQRQYFIDGLAQHSLEILGEVPARLVAGMMTGLGMPVDESTVRKRLGSKPQQVAS